MSLPGRRPRLLAAALVLAGAVALFASGASAATSNHRLPRALVLLESRMEHLQIHSERWEEVVRETSRGGASHADNSPSLRLVGLVGEDPPEGELFRAGYEGRSGYVLSGSNLDVWVPSSCAPGRPWITTPDPEDRAALPIDPFAGGRGPVQPYGSLIAAMASSKVVELGPRIFSGRPVTAFLAVRSVPEDRPPLGFVAAARPHRVSERIEVFIDGEGLPLRVVTRKGSARGGIEVVVNVVAVNLPQPLGITAPPAGQTRPKSNESCNSESSAK